MRHWALYKIKFFFVDLPLFVRGASPFTCLTFSIAVTVVIVIICDTKVVIFACICKKNGSKFASVIHLLT